MVLETAFVFFGGVIGGYVGSSNDKTHSVVGSSAGIAGLLSGNIIRTCMSAVRFFEK